NQSAETETRTFTEYGTYSTACAKNKSPQELTKRNSQCIVCHSGKSIKVRTQTFEPYFYATKENPMNEATREAVKKHLRDKESELRTLQIEIKHEQRILDLHRTREEELECLIEDLREDLGEDEDVDEDGETDSIAKIYVDVVPRFDKIKEAFTKLAED